MLEGTFLISFVYLYSYTNPGGRKLFTDFKADDLQLMILKYFKRRRLVNKIHRLIRQTYEKSTDLSFEPTPSLGTQEGSFLVRMKERRPAY